MIFLQATPLHQTVSKFVTDGERSLLDSPFCKVFGVDGVKIAAGRDENEKAIGELDSQYGFQTNKKTGVGQGKKTAVS